LKTHFDLKGLKQKLVKHLERNKIPYRFITCDKCPMAQACGDAYKAFNLDGKCAYKGLDARQERGKLKKAISLLVQASNRVYEVGEFYFGKQIDRIIQQMKKWYKFEG